jgi:hypothetical protein
MDAVGCCRNIQIRPFPYPLGRDGKLPLCSSSWDGFHITGAHSGTFIKDSYIVNTGRWHSIHALAMHHLTLRFKRILHLVKGSPQSQQNQTGSVILKRVRALIC